MGQADGSKAPEKFPAERERQGRETEHGNGNRQRSAALFRPSKMESLEELPEEEWRNLMAGMELLHCELLSSRGWARAPFLRGTSQ